MKIGRLTAVWVLVVSVLFFGTWKLANARTFQLFGEIIPRVETSRRVVALTFDDGPTRGYTEAVLKILREENIKATFFLIGSELAQNHVQGQEIAAAGHELGNHSYSHTRMVFKSPAFIRNEIESTDKLIRKAGYEGEIHFRPPYCKKLLYLPYYLSSTGRKTITMDLEPETDPQNGASADSIIKYVVDKVQPGSIILLHPMYQSRVETRNSIAPIIRQLKAKGYTFVTVSELVRSEGL